MPAIHEAIICCFIQFFQLLFCFPATDPSVSSKRKRTSERMENGSGNETERERGRGRERKGEGRKEGHTGVEDFGDVGGKHG